ncbi:MAG: cytochrome C oxidase subunit IV family protein [Sulfurimonas sp.]|nr:cytochrome C oxidase subunit IV family protein [Sulfurimonas sp.]
MMDVITRIWIALVGFTIFAFLLGWLKLVSLIGVGILLFTTFLKGQLVIDYFMGLNEVELKYRVIPTIWLGIVISLIAVAYYLPV